MTDSTVRIRLVTHTAPLEPHGAELPTSLSSPALPWRPALVEDERDHERVVVSSVTTRAQGATLDVVLAGDVDLLLRDELALVVAEAERHARSHPRATVHVDVRDVAAVDATAIRFLEQLRRRTAGSGARCTLSEARPAVREVLALARTVPSGELAAG